MGIFDLYLILCAALQLHELSIRCFVVLSTNDFHGISLVRQAVDISKRWWSSSGIKMKLTLPHLCMYTWCKKGVGAEAGPLYLDAALDLP